MQELYVQGEVKNIPTSWDEVTLLQLEKLSEAKDEIDCVAIFLDMESDRLRNSKDVEGFNRVLIALYFIKEKIDIPKINNLASIEFRGESYKFKDLEDITIAQNLDIKVISSRKFERIYESQATIFAIYLQQLVNDGKYSFESAKTLIDDVYKMSAFDVIQAVSFFLNKSISSIKDKKRGLLTDLILKTKLGQVLRGLSVLDS